MSSTNQSNTTTTQQKQQTKGSQKPRGKRSSPSGSSSTRRYKLVPMDRDPEGKGAPPLVKGTKGAFLNRIHEVSGCNCRFLSAGEQRNFKAIEVNTGDARILEITIDTEVEMPTSNYSRRLNKACQMVAGAIMHWRHIEYPPPEEDGDGGDDGHTSDDPTAQSSEAPTSEAPSSEAQNSAEGGSADDG